MKILASPALRCASRWLYDAQGFATAILVVALGLCLLRSADLLTGGVPGLAFLTSYATGIPMGWSLFLVNLPFCLVAWCVVGMRFTISTMAIVFALSFAVEAIQDVLSVHSTHPMFAAIAGGLLIGMGLLVLFQHDASLGGFGVVAIYLQRRYGWKTGTVQLACDAVVVGLIFLAVEPRRVLYSVVSCLVVNLVLLWNHRPAPPLGTAADAPIRASAPRHV